MKDKKYADLTDALVICFEQYLDTEDEHRLHEDSFVTKTLKKFLGKKEFDSFNSMDEQYWKTAWREFDLRTFKK